MARKQNIKQYFYTNDIMALVKCPVCNHIYVLTKTHIKQTFNNSLMEIYCTNKKRSQYKKIISEYYFHEVEK